MTRNADALAELFAEHGVAEAPLVPSGVDYPARLEGREQIRAGMAAFYQRTAPAGQPGEGKDGAPSAAWREVDAARSGYVLHTTADPDVFIAEVDTVLNGRDGSTTVSLVQIFRVRDGKIARLRDYFSPAIVS